MTGETSVSPNDANSDSARLARIERLQFAMADGIGNIEGAQALMLGVLQKMWPLVQQIHEACCGPQPPSELAAALRSLADAVQRNTDAVLHLVARMNMDIGGRK